uniref:Alpha-ketoglutarate-dependent dioxygenase AlkB-like domain-containing protein n=1 Tax=Kwoniella bestiolae CBS 10118 TaxID=1296100 RepID=A0A1B9G1Y3_9TREE|nr:hypothetical protein I302_04839 [Kwoniella bestiolae CBS 10118]OCF25029.1 hypothetical protein I302_04839 [Kwoniella bestiolae CBS 10118]
MPSRKRASSSSLSPPPTSEPEPKKSRTSSRSKSKPQTRHEPTDEFQQVTLPSFVDRWKVGDMGYGGDVYYQPDFIEAEEAQGWYDELLNLDTYQPTLKLYGRTFPQSRQIAAYSTVPDATLSYSGSEITMHYPFPPILETIRKQLEEELGVRFNHCMLNRYDDGSVYIGKHSDNLNNLVIASISLGAERRFIMSPRLPSKAGKQTMPTKEVEEELEARKNISWM